MKKRRILEFLPIIFSAVILLMILFALLSSSITETSEERTATGSISSSFTAIIISETPSPVPATPVPIDTYSAPVFTQKTDLLTKSNVGRTAELSRFGKGWPSSMAYSPDGVLLAVGTSLGVDIRTASTGHPLAFYPSTAPVLSLAFSPDGKWLAAGLQDGRIALYDSRTGSIARWLESHSRPVRGLAFSRPERTAGPASMLASGDEAGTIVVWDLASGQSRYQFSNPLFGYWGYGIRSLAFSPQNLILATGGDQGYVTRWDLTTGEELPHLKSQHGLIFSIDFSPDGKYLASACGDGTVQVWNFAAGSRLFRLEGHEYGTWSVAYSADGKTIATGAGDGMVRLWDSATQKLTAEKKVSNSQVDSVEFSKDGLNLAVVSIGESVQVVRTGNLAPDFPMRSFFGSLRSGVYADSGTRMVFTGENGVVYLWDSLKGKVTVMGEPRPANKAAMAAVTSPDGKTLAVADGVQNSLRFFSYPSLAQLGEQRVQGIRAVTYSQDGAFLAAGGLELIVMETISKRIQRLNLPVALTSLAFLQVEGESQTHLAAGLENGAVIAWDLKTGDSRELFTGDGASIWSLAANKNILASGDSLGRIQVWDLRQSKQLLDLSGNSSSIFSIAISPDGSMLAHGGRDGIIRILDLQTGRQLSALGGHNGMIYGIAFSPDGRQILSTSADGSARVWGVKP